MTTTTTTSLSTIWGIDARLESALGNERLDAKAPSVSIERQLHTFLTQQLKLWKPDFLVVNERKGTAIVRSLLESSDNPLDWPWEKIISSSALETIPPDFLTNKRLLIFDDMLRTGQHLAQIATILRNRGFFGDGRNIKFAVFARHEESYRHGKFETSPLQCSWFYSALTTEAFQNIRRQIVEMLQRAGSLMLDTEHIEVRFKLNGGLNSLVETLRRRADVMVFRSLANRTNITVYYGDDEAHSLPEWRFPKDTGYTKIVKKCRIVQRQADEFAIIPICLPSVTAEPIQWPTDEDDRTLLGEAARTDIGRFHAVAILGSLYPLSWILKDLYASETFSCNLSLPSKGRTSNTNGYTLEHLRVMFPTLKIELLVDEIAKVAYQAREDGNAIRRSGDPSAKSLEGTVPDVANDELHRRAISLLQAIGDELHQRIAEQCIIGGHRPPSAEVPGLRAREIFDIGTKEFHWDPVCVSTLFDILIDDANLVTRVEKTLDVGGTWRWTRTFKPDGEVVTDLLRRFTRQWGLPHGR